MGVDCTCNCNCNMNSNSGNNGNNKDGDKDKHGEEKNSASVESGTFAGIRGRREEGRSSGRRGRMGWGTHGF